MKPKLSIGMMVKNEEHNLERCLNSLRPLREAVTSELIIVDTGSTDKTVEFARRYTDQIYSHPWENDFSAMRNITISYAHGEWFLLMDADEELTDIQPIVDFLNSPDRNRFGAVAFDGKNFTDSNDLSSFSMMMTLHLFKNDGYFHYEGAVHNQPVFKGEAYYLPVTLLHYGYLSNDPELMERKFQRTSGILKNELEKDPDNMYYWYQLSVSYGMHNDIVLAIDAIEKAYKLYKQQKSDSSMYIYTHMALMYQMARDFEKVEKCCEESLKVKDGYIDIYYFLAEAKTALGKIKDGITYYEKYFRLVDEIEERQHDLAVPEYAMAHQNMAVYNMINLYRALQRYEDSLVISERITDHQLKRESLQSIIFAYGKLQKFNELRIYYNKEWQADQEFFFETLEKMIYEFFEGDQVAIATQFSDVDHPYGLLSQIILEYKNGWFPDALKTRINAIQVSHLPVYVSEIFYYLLKVHYPLEKVVGEFKENWFVPAFSYIKERHEDLGIIIEQYLSNRENAESLADYKLRKMFYRYALLFNGLEEIKYHQVFKQYIMVGSLYLQSIYSSQVLNEKLAHELKNDEEVFLLYMHYAVANEKANEFEYIRYLRLALQAFPAMKRGIEYLLGELKQKNSEQKDEFDQYKATIKSTIRQLIDDGNNQEATALLSEYKSIVPNDIEAVLLESKILLN